jgi:hypothetical protein
MAWPLVRGLFGTYVLFHNDGLFKRFVIGSPSLWWNNRVILSVEESFAASRKPLPARVFFQWACWNSAWRQDIHWLLTFGHSSTGWIGESIKALNFRCISLKTKPIFPLFRQRLAKGSVLYIPRRRLIRRRSHKLAG